ncbi:alpha/beta-hydrolase [Zopfia rhizophila CBS 207.26]|uniref:Alpha/beta-hydrolase n=1 Tax=Zopfia rhizophila CBS 207.26 TaxID=1314779 RepID=A0A6A6DKV3_9PEZI|nr:alpha/beta-hydrolase [Zopfia rhizophila CBS 207.26]
MEQANIPAPEVTSGPGYSTVYALYLHTTAWLLRKAVASMTGVGSLFDKHVCVDTPGLGEGHVKCSVCIPRKIKEPQNSLPLVLVIEGGGFILGQPTDGEHIDRLMSDNLQAVVVSVDYAKSPRYPFPHALLQLYQVLKWCLSSDAASTLRVTIDPTRVAIMGNSAGGNLTASLSLLTAFTEGPCNRFRDDLPKNYRQVAQVLLYPSTACNRLYRTRLTSAGPEVQAKSLPVWVAELMEASYLPPYVEKEQIFVAPLLITSYLLRELQPQVAPAACYVAGLDCLKDEAVQYCRKLENAGVNACLKEYPEAVHGFSHYKEGSKDFRKGDVGDCWESICRFLEGAFSVDMDRASDRRLHVRG